jgi:GNAT superfamily N-acetyltransferase
MSVTIRRAVKEDAQAVAALALKLVTQHQEYDPIRFSRLGDLEGMAWFYGSQTEAEDAAVFVAEADAKIVGFAFVQFEERNYAGLLKSAAWLHDIYIEETARGRRIGEQLIEAATAAAKGFGADKLMLSVAAKNEAGREFFSRMGFRETMVEMMLSLDH